jgi:hypothetical protein
MDIVAHGLWAGVGAAVASRRWPIKRRTAAAIVALAMAPDLYPAPISYPFTQWGFDGLAWNTPWFLLANHAAIALAIAWLLWRRWSASRGRR